MTKYLISMTAMIIAIGTVAFKNPDNSVRKLTTVYFYYDAPGGTDYSEASVADLANWSSTLTISCNGVNNKACRIEVEVDFTHLENGIRILNTSGSVVVIQVSGSTYKFVVSGTGIASVTNKS